jgi:hypothetical protein
MQDGKKHTVIMVNKDVFQELKRLNETVRRQVLEKRRRSDVNFLKEDARVLVRATSSPLKQVLKTPLHHSPLCSQINLAEAYYIFQLKICALHGSLVDRKDQI